jgi:hypothetical protein
VIDGRLEVRVLRVDHQPHAQRLGVQRDTVQSGEHPFQAGTLVHVERGAVEGALGSTALYERSYGMQWKRVGELHEVDVAVHVGVDALKDRLDLLV